MHVVIIGNGIAGVSAALRLRERSREIKITLISGESTYHYSRPALMYLFMGHMSHRDILPYEDHTWAEKRIELLRDWVVGIDTAGKQVLLRKQGSLSYDELILATGSVSNKFGWPGQDLPGVQGLYDLFDLRLLEERLPKIRRAVLVGGGLIGVELAEMLLSRKIPVTFLVREAAFWNVVLPTEESLMVTELIRHHGIDLRLSTELEAIHAGPDGTVASVTTKSGDSIAAEFVGLTVGVSPNVALAKHAGIPCGRGVLVDRKLRSQVPHIWAVGDCAEVVTGEPRNLIQQVWYTGRFQGEHAADGILGDVKNYDSGIWFNSAKFFDLEYQTYGQVNRNDPGEASLFWRHPTEAIAIRIVHVEGRVIGFNVMGTRFRHRVCEDWLRKRASLDEVLSNLGRAAFDPEFFARHEKAAVAAWTEGSHS